MTIWAALALAAGIALSTAAAADENQDLDLIPGDARSAPATEPAPVEPSTAGATRRIFLENVLTGTEPRNNVLVAAPAPAPRWQERLLLDVRKSWRPGSDVQLTYSGRLNLRAEDGLDFPTHENVSNDLREAYASWEPHERTFIDAGRINLKSGVALGFNPTDYFKTRAVVAPLSADPSELRDDRLGTLMVRAQQIWEGASVTAAFAPAVSSRSPLYQSDTLPSFDPMFDRTNAVNRFLLKASVAAGDLNPEVLLYRESNETRLGLNVAQSIGQSTIVYGEWSGGRRTRLIDDALRFGRATGTLPANSPNAPSPLAEDSHRRFQSELALGASYTTATKVTFNLEFHFEQAAFTRTDWDRWFSVGQGSSGTSPIARELWFFRGYALDQQEPISRSSLFLRADWVDAFIPKLELSGFVNTDLLDGSRLVQVAADYYASGVWTVGGVGIASFGSRHSDFGSVSPGWSVLIKVSRYL